MGNKRKISKKNPSFSLKLVLDRNGYGSRLGGERERQRKWGAFFSGLGGGNGSGLDGEGERNGVEEIFNKDSKKNGFEV